MSLRVLLALLCLLACAAVPPKPEDGKLQECETPCGLKAFVYSEAQCASLKRFEARDQAEFGKDVTLFTPKDMCAAEEGWMIIVHKQTDQDRLECTDGAWLMPAGATKMCVIGYTHEGLHVVELSDDDFQHNSLAHELVHVTTIHKFKYTNHCGWAERGIKKALLAVTGSEDDTYPGADCYNCTTHTADAGSDVECFLKDL
jgi:hypothetical protein